MRFVYLSLILAGVGAYAMAAMGSSPDREIYSDIGNGILLFNIALMLVIDRLDRRE